MSSNPKSKSLGRKPNNKQSNAKPTTNIKRRHSTTNISHKIEQKQHKQKNKKEFDVLINL